MSVLVLMHVVVWGGCMCACMEWNEGHAAASSIAQTCAARCQCGVQRLLRGQASHQQPTHSMHSRRYRDTHGHTETETETYLLQGTGQAHSSASPREGAVAQAPQASAQTRRPLTAHTKTGGVPAPGGGGAAAPAAAAADDDVTGQAVATPAAAAAAVWAAVARPQAPLLLLLQLLRSRLPHHLEWA